LERDAVLEQLNAAVGAGALVLTANQRLSRTLRRMYDEAQARAGRRVWNSARILPLAAWLRQTWSEAALCGGLEPRFLLSDCQAEAIWRRIIESSPESAELVGVREAAVSAVEAWRLMYAYRLPWNEALFAAHDDWAAFFRWAAAFRRECDEHGWIDEARVADRVAEAAATRCIPLPPSVLLAGFDEFTPQQQLLLDALGSAGCAPQTLAEAPASPEITRTSAADTFAELGAAAHWARALLESGASRAGIVIPRLAALRDDVERIFEEVLHPERRSSPDAPAPAAFHISAGRPLSAYPIIAASLNALELGAPGLALNQAGCLLRSPYLAGGDAEATSRALLDVALRRLRRAEISIDTVRQFATRQDATYYSPQFAKLLDACAAVRTGFPKAAPPSAWARSVDLMLQAAGWPGDRTLNSVEYQAAGRWRELLERFASLDIAARDWSAGRAFARLRELAGETRFQPEDEDAPLQIMGVLEAAGASFDHLWITGLDDRSWPSPARPHPFLPLSLQRRHKLPHSSPEREMEFSRQALARLKSSAPRIVVSWPEREGDFELRPSFLIEAAPFKPLSSPPASIRRARLEVIEDAAPALAAERASGGVSILKRQAECPFRAFAEFRLGAKPLEAGELGISPADRGSAAHRALELLWARLESHARLMALAPEELERIAAECAREALRRDGLRGSEFQRRFVDMERERLARLLLEWLQLERSRRPFTVARREEKRSFEIGGLTIDGRIDRVDVLDDGREIILDYKSNAPSVAAWNGERPDEPQIPFYAISNPSMIAAVAFGQLAPGAVRFKGYAEQEDLLPGAKSFPGAHDAADYDSLEQLIAAWRPRLERLAADFRAGRAAVDPKDGDKTCSNCHLGGLCRVRDTGGGAAGEDGDGA
jgi:ATP-dependent helicase/nuclease subunit B